MAPEAQHAWEDTYATDALGRPLPARYHRLLMFDVTRAPRPADAAQLERALLPARGAPPSRPRRPAHAAGLGIGIFRTTYRRAPHRSPRPWRWPAVNMRELQDIDACLHLASDDEDRLDDAVAALLWEDELGVGCPLNVREVRTGCVGAGLPARFAAAPVPADSPLLLGFHSGLRRNQATRGRDHDPRRPPRGRHDDARLAHQPRPRSVV